MAEKSKKIEEKKEEVFKEEKKEREIVVPGEVIAKGSDYLPGDFTSREGDKVIARRFGLAEKSGRLVKVIPLSGVYVPRVGNIVIGKVKDVTFNGWITDIIAPQQSFLQLIETGRYVNKNDITEYLDIGDMVVCKVLRVKNKGIDLTTKGRGLGKLEEGIIIKINSNKVPRVIGRGGSMINLIKEETLCNITVGQNGVIWIKGKDVESELLAKEAILFIVSKSFVEGLTEKVQEFFKNKNKEKK